MSFCSNLFPPLLIMLEDKLDFLLNCKTSPVYECSPTFGLKDTSYGKILMYYKG